jgi:hypothetical protein
MVTYAMCYGHASAAADCVRPVAFSGAGSNSCHSLEYEFTEVMSLGTGYNTKMLLPTIPSNRAWRSQDLYQRARVPKRFSKVFKGKQENSVHHFAEMAKPLSTNKIFCLSKERGLLIFDNGAMITLTESLMNMFGKRIFQLNWPATG